ncbi:MAG: hypothetical protein WCS94_19615, partial [Verrucomicrobiota bacterium]
MNVLKVFALLFGKPGTIGQLLFALRRRFSRHGFKPWSVSWWQIHSFRHGNFLRNVVVGNDGFAIRLVACQPSVVLEDGYLP